MIFFVVFEICYNVLSNVSLKMDKICFTCIDCIVDPLYLYSVRQILDSTNSNSKSKLVVLQRSAEVTDRGGGGLENRKERKQTKTKQIAPMLQKQTDKSSENKMPATIC